MENTLSEEYKPVTLQQLRDTFVRSLLKAAQARDTHKEELAQKNFAAATIGLYKETTDIALRIVKTACDKTELIFFSGAQGAPMVLSAYETSVAFTKMAEYVTEVGTHGSRSKTQQLIQCSVKDFSEEVVKGIAELFEGIPAELTPEENTPGLGGSL